MKELYLMYGTPVLFNSGGQVNEETVKSVQRATTSVFLRLTIEVFLLIGMLPFFYRMTNFPGFDVVTFSLFLSAFGHFVLEAWSMYSIPGYVVSVGKFFNAFFKTFGIGVICFSLLLTKDTFSILIAIYFMNINKFSSFFANYRLYSKLIDIKQNGWTDEDKINFLFIGEIE